MEIKAPLEKGTAEEKLIELLGVDQETPDAAKFVDLTGEEKDIQVVDTDGQVIGVIDLTRDWIRL